MNDYKNEIVQRLVKGENQDDIAKEITAILNSAVEEYNSIKSVECASFISGID